MKELAALEKAIGYAFQDKQLLIAALTHSTYANAHGGEDNERLEYLGDAILQFIVTERQYLASKADEGALTKSRQGAVCEDALLNAVKEMGLESWLRFEGGSQNIGKKTLSSLYESVLAAVYLDGGMEAAKAFVERHPTDENKARNYKGDLQEFLQGKGLPIPTYENGEEGEVFYSVVRALGKAGEGRATSKRAAEQSAAKDLLTKLKRENV